MKRKSILFKGKNELEIIEEPVPEPMPGQVLVQTTRSMISTGTELICLTRNFGPDGAHWEKWVKYPFRTGYLNVGRVTAIGEGVTGWKPGDRVASRGGHTSHLLIDDLSTWKDGISPRGDGKGPSVGVRIPEVVGDEEAVWMGLAKIVQIGIRQAEHKLGDTVAVIGLGLLGQLVVQYARLFGAAEIIAIDTSPLRLSMAAAHGATHTLNMTAGEAKEQVAQITGGQGVDVVYEVTGYPAVFQQALPLARKFGTLVLLGDSGTPSEQRLTNDIGRRGVKVVGAHDGYPPPLPNPYVRWSALQMYELFFTYVARGQMRTLDLVTHHYPPHEAVAAYEMLQRDRLNAMGVMFDWTGGT